MNVFQLPTAPAGSMLALIAWAYLISNAVRVFSYLPQVIAVWRCRDGARSISLLTWFTWTVSHVTAAVYGLLVVRDAFFVFVSLVNMLGCGVVSLIAARRRLAARQHNPGSPLWKRA